MVQLVFQICGSLLFNSSRDHHQIRDSQQTSMEHKLLRYHAGCEPRVKDTVCVLDMTGKVPCEVLRMMRCQHLQMTTYCQFEKSQLLCVADFNLDAPRCAHQRLRRTAFVSATRGHDPTSSRECSSPWSPRVLSLRLQDSSLHRTVSYFRLRLCLFGCVHLFVRMVLCLYLSSCLSLSDNYKRGKSHNF